MQARTKGRATGGGMEGEGEGEDEDEDEDDDEEEADEGCRLSATAEGSLLK